MHERNTNQPPKTWTHAVKKLAVLLTMIALAVAGMSAVADEITGNDDTAWDVLVAERPQVVDGGTVTPIERRILQLLTPAQADELSQGTASGRIELADGRSLAELIAQIQREDDAGLVFKPVIPCAVLDTRETGQSFAADETRVLKLRGADSDGSAADGCGIPGLHGRILRTNRARSVFLTVRVVRPEGEGDLRIWPANDHPQPQVGLLDYGADPAQTYESSVVVSLCDEIGAEPCAAGDVKVRTHGAGAHLVLSVLGWFQAVRPAALSADPLKEDTAVAAKSATEPFWEAGTDGKIFYSDGNVGIGSTSPNSKLVVTHDAAINGEPGASVTIDAKDSTANEWALGLRASTGPGTVEDLMVVRGDGRVGIGTRWPAADLHVAGKGRFDADLILADNTMIRGIGALSTTADGGIFFSSATGGNQGINVTPGYQAYMMHNVYWDGTQWIQPRGSLYSQAFTIGHHYSASWWRSAPREVNNAPVDLEISMAIRKTDGNVGIGIGNPESKLVVSNNGFAGNPDWAAAISSATSDDTTVVLNLCNSDEQSVFYARSDGNVGIGTTAPGEKLEVSGNFKLTGNIIPAGDICIGNCN